MLKTNTISLLLIIITSQLWSLDKGPELLASSAILYDYTTGRVLYEKDADLPIPPASMTKLITLYLGWKNLEDGRVSRDQLIEISSEGSSFTRPIGSSLMLLEEGQNVTFLDIMKGLAISSGNDAAYAIANLLSDSTENFIKEMNGLVADLGYKSMYFEDPDGWSANNIVTAREYAQFSADYIRSFPYALEEIHSQEYFTYPKEQNLPLSGARIITARKKKNTNILLGKVPGVDGLKTGYIDESGFNFTATAKRKDSRFIAVILGIKDVSYFDGIELRAKEAAELLEYGFSNYRTIYPVIPQFNDIKLWEGVEDVLEIQLEDKPVFTLSDDEMTSFSSTIQIPDELDAPIIAGDHIGSVVYKTDRGELQSFPVTAVKTVEKANIFKVLWHKIVKKYRNITHP